MARIRKTPPAEARQTVPWEKIATELRSHPGQAVLFDEFEDTPRVRSLLTMVNSGKVPAFDKLPGEVRASMRNTRLNGIGLRTGELWLTFTPDPVGGQMLSQSRRSALPQVIQFSESSGRNSANASFCPR